jgi:LacI family transcriptional regulator
MTTVNLKYLAEKLNLSVSTVSKAFRNSYDINPQTKQRILALAKELDFEPNPLASGLRTQQTKTIAVIIPEIANTFFTEVINGIESVAQTENFHVLIYITHEDEKKESDFIKNLQSGRVDGILISLSSASSIHQIAELQAKGLPIVFFDRIVEADHISKVTTNDFESGYLATKHLIEKGCRRVAHLSIPNNLSIAAQRKSGYFQALKDQGIPADEELVINCSNDERKNKDLIKGLLSDKRPDGIFSAFEKLAMLTYEACAELNISIPGNVKLVSFSNLQIASLLDPSLTTLSQPAFDIGKQAAKLLFKALHAGEQQTPEHFILKSALQVRNSTA